MVVDKMNEYKSRILIANPVVYSLLCMLAVNINLLSGDDRDRMVVSGAHHLTNRTPLSSSGLELQYLIPSVSTS